MSTAEESPASSSSALARVAEQARGAIYDDDQDRLRALLHQFPALVSWTGEDGQTLLDFTTSYAMDCSDPERERTYTRPAAAELLIDAGAIVQPRTLDNIIKTGSSGMLALFARKGAVSRTPPVLAALGDDSAAARTAESGHEETAVDTALKVACRFTHVELALRLLERAIAADAELGRRIDDWGSRRAFVEFLSQQPSLLWQADELTPWQAFVFLQLSAARQRGDLVAFTRWLDDEPWVLEPEFVETQARLLLPACYEKGHGVFITALLDRDPALVHASPPPRSSHIAQALSYGNAHVVPMLMRVWPLADDLPHAAGMGDATAVARWFDAGGHAALGSLMDHYPASDPEFPRADLHWGPPSVQQVLDVAFAWAVLNRHFAIAVFLLERGANIDTSWATHEPASVLHEAAIQGNEDAVRFLIEHGADLTITDYRYRSTAEGWARHGSRDAHMADLLAAAADARGG